MLTFRYFRSISCGVFASCLLAIVGAVPASAEGVPSNMRGRWVISDTDPTMYPATVFARFTIKIGQGSVNSTVGSMTTYASGGKKTCSARLTYLGLDGDGRASFAIRFKSGAPRRARGFCRPSRSNGERLVIAKRSEQLASMVIYHRDVDEFNGPMYATLSG